MYPYRRNSDVDIRQLERELSASGSQEIADKLLLAYRRAGRELDYLYLLDQYGPRLGEHGWYVANNRGGNSLFLPRLTPAQEQRFQHLVWTSLVQSAITADKTGRIDIQLLREAEKFIDRNIHSMWSHSVFLDVASEDSPDTDKETGRQNSGCKFDEDDTAKAKIHCKSEEGDVDLYDKTDYIEYWKEHPQSLIDDPWDNTTIWIRDNDSELSWWSRPRLQVPWDGTLENLGYVGGGNLTGIGFMYHHRNCSYNPYKDMDPNDPMNQPPPDTPSLPPRGAEDPNWRRNPDEKLRNAERAYNAFPTDENFGILIKENLRAGLPLEDLYSENGRCPLCFLVLNLDDDYDVYDDDRCQLCDRWWPADEGLIEIRFDPNTCSHQAAAELNPGEWWCPGCESRIDSGE
jgi:hypothetical protein